MHFPMQTLSAPFPHHQMESHVRGAGYGTAAAAASPRRARMAIDLLLNPTPDDADHGSRSSSHFHQPNNTSVVPPPYSPTTPGSRRDYLYTQYRDSHAYTDSAAGTPQTSEQIFTPSHHSQSTRSSPDPYSHSHTHSHSHSHSRERYGSVSSSSSTTAAAGAAGASGAADRRRPPRPKYEEEEMYFIWYHRVDLSLEWKEVRESFNQQFADRQRRGFQGIQCKFYRFIKEKKCPTLREQRRMRDGEFLTQGAAGENASVVESGAPRFGVVEWMGVWYPWMRESREEVLRRRIVR